MIKSFKHKALERFYRKGAAIGIQARHTQKLRFQLAALDSAHQISDLDLPGYRLHPLKGQRQGVWSITVSANWRLTFQFSNSHVYSLDYEDYH